MSDFTSEMTSVSGLQFAVSSKGVISKQRLHPDSDVSRASGRLLRQKSGWEVEH